MNIDLRQFEWNPHSWTDYSENWYYNKLYQSTEKSSLFCTAVVSANILHHWKVYQPSMSLRSSVPATNSFRSSLCLPPSPFFDTPSVIRVFTTQNLWATQAVTCSLHPFFPERLHGQTQQHPTGEHFPITYTCDTTANTVISKTPECFKNPRPTNPAHGSISASPISNKFLCFFWSSVG